MAENHEFRVSPTELDYLKKLALEDESFSRLLNFEEGLAGRKVIMRLSRAEAGQLREYLMTRMGVVGFDENYKPNEQGQMLETLIDRFFIH